MIPAKKISQTLLEYAEPLMLMYSGECTKIELEAMLRMAVAAWNACVLDHWRQNGQQVAAVRQALANGHPVQKAMIEMLIERKAQLFAHDVRAISNETVIVRDGAFIVSAEARMDIEYMDATGGVQ